MTFDLRELRNAFGSFLTGVTVVTTIDNEGKPAGFTANSFTSVSLDPALLLVCLAKNADCYEAFSKTEAFAVNVLSELQQELSGVFATKNVDKFLDVEPKRESTRSPVFHGDCAWFDCEVTQRIDAGDHLILIGRVLDFNYREREPLGYLRGGYVTLGMERSAVRAWSFAQKLETGAIIDKKRHILLIEDPDTGLFSLPLVEAKPYANPVKRAEKLLSDLGLTASQPFLYSVYKDDRTEKIYYRFLSAQGEPREGEFIHLDEIPWQALVDDAVHSMLHRYAQERVAQRFGVYLGDFDSGIVR